MSKLSREQSLQLVRERLKERGDMPIFSASVNRVHVVGSDPDADAMALSVEILKDANLTTKVLKLANSPLYNRGQGKIGNLSRAVVVLGFDTVKSVVLTLKLLDSFQQQFPGIDMTGMLVNAFLSAGFVRRVSTKAGVKDIEQAYICGLLHNLGEVVVAYTLPEQFRQIDELQREENLPRAVAEKRILGATLADLGQDVLNDWEFPQNVIKTLSQPNTGGGTRIRNQVELTAALAGLSNQTMELLYADRPHSGKTLAELNHELSKVAGIRREEISEALEQSFRQSCELAQAYGLSKKHLTPRLRAEGDDDLEKLARQFSFYASNEITTPDVAGEKATEAQLSEEKMEAPTATATSTATAEKSATLAADPNLLLGILFEITTLMAQRAHVNIILGKVLEGMHHGIGFDRAVLCLLNPDHTHYAARMSAGNNVEALKTYLDFAVRPEQDLFSKIIMEGSELLVSDIDSGDWRSQLPADFEQMTGSRAFILGALRSKGRPVGIFYADKAVSGAPISAEDSRSFTQLVAQAQLALQMR
jgi:HD-like signal output (HDOD) protein